MKRILTTITAIIVFVSCAAQDPRAFEFPHGTKVTGDTTVTTVPATYSIPVRDPNGFSGKIVLADFISQLNISTGNLTQEEAEDIIGTMLASGDHTGATITYNDNGTDPGTIDIEVTGGGSITLDATIIDGSTNGVEGNAIFDRFVQMVEEAANSPDQVVWWKGTKAQFYAIYGNPPTGLQDWIYQITDSIPATPAGGGDMLASNYDGNSNFVVDDSENLNGQPPGFYLDNTNLTQEEVQDLVGTMFNGGTEDGGDISYDDVNDRVDLTISAGTGNIQDGAVTAIKLGSDVYEQVPFTPTLTDEGGGATYTLSQANGTMTRILDFKCVKIFIETTGTTGTPTGDLVISGLPAVSGGWTNSVGSVRMQGLTMPGHSSSDILARHLVVRGEAGEITILSDIDTSGIMNPLSAVSVGNAQIEIILTTPN